MATQASADNNGSIKIITGTKQYFDGLYVGEMTAEGELKHGRGTMTYKSGNKYEGEWEDDFRHGHGTFYWPNQCKYEGQFVSGQMGGESKGSFYSALGKKCEATWISAPHTVIPANR